MEHTEAGGYWRREKLEVEGKGAGRPERDAADYQGRTGEAWQDVEGAREAREGEEREGAR